MTMHQELISKYSDRISKCIKLSNYSWFNLGGPAEFLFKPKDKNQLLEFLEDNKKNNMKITVLGAGSNTLIRDNGIKGIVIKLGQSFSKIKLLDKCLIEVGSATSDRKISNFAKENEIGNLEFLSCIPGSIGGGVIMNSGCYGNDISKVLVSIKAIDINECKEKVINRKEIEFFYRGSNLSKNLIITSVILEGKVEKQEIIAKKQSEMIEKNYLNLVR